MIVEDYWKTSPSVDSEMEFYFFLQKESHENVQAFPEPYKSIFEKHKTWNKEQFHEKYPEMFL